MRSIQKCSKINKKCRHHQQNAIYCKLQQFILFKIEYISVLMSGTGSYERDMHHRIVKLISQLIVIMRFLSLTTPSKYVAILIRLKNTLSHNQIGLTLLVKLRKQERILIISYTP